MPALSAPPCLFSPRFPPQTLLTSSNLSLSHFLLCQRPKAHHSIIYLFLQLKVFSELQLVTVGRMWGLCIGALVIISITHFVYRWRNPRCNGKLPPGSMGFPLLGETLQFFTPNTSSDIPPFVKKRMDR